MQHILRQEMTPPELTWDCGTSVILESRPTEGEVNSRHLDIVD